MKFHGLNENFQSDVHRLNYSDSDCVLRHALNLFLVLGRMFLERRPERPSIRFRVLVEDGLIDRLIYPKVQQFPKSMVRLSLDECHSQRLAGPLKELPMLLIFPQARCLMVPI